MTSLLVLTVHEIRDVLEGWFVRHTFVVYQSIVVGH